MKLDMLVRTILCFFFLYPNPGFGFEPKCSRFHYEEQTLEKMIRQEIFVEKMKSNMDETKHQVDDALVTFKNEREKFSSNFDKLETFVKTLTEKVEKTLERVKADTNTILGDYTQEIENLKGIIVTPTIAFKANGVPDRSVSNGKILIFTTNSFNIGNGYENKTGIFKAPVGGLYHFTAQLCFSGGSQSFFGISVNGELISKALFGDNAWTKCYSMDTISSVTKGDLVSVKCIGSCDSDDRLYELRHAENSFAGVLIHK